MRSREAFYGPNVGYVLELYEQYLQDSESVEASTRNYFSQLDAEGGLDALANLVRSNGGYSSPTSGARTSIKIDTQASSNVSSNGTQGCGAEAPQLGKDVALRVVVAARLARSIREYGHLAANIDPLGNARPGDPMLEPRTHGVTDEDLATLPASIVWPEAEGTCLAGIERLRSIYSGTLGYEFDHVQNYDERAWLHEVVEEGRFRRPLPPDRRRALLERLAEVEGLERYLHTVFVGQKRFSIEGNDMLVPMLDELVRNAAQTGIREVMFGMAHRGRLNVLAHVLGKPYESIIAEFQHAKNTNTDPSQGSSAITSGWTGDVKYHKGARRTVHEGKAVLVQLTLADNASHLEFVDPVVAGFARAAQDRRDRPGEPFQDMDAALSVTIHGDAAFPGEGVVAETLNLSGLKGYRTGGSIRIIVNNQIGFTTGPDAGRSTIYASDPAKGYEIPVVHVNADDPEACLAAIQMACAYRERFHKDFLIDLVGYRRWGHNEGDEPSFTQPGMYEGITHHPTVWALYRDLLVKEGVVAPDDAENMVARVRETLQLARDEAEAHKVETVEGSGASKQSIEVAPVSQETLRSLSTSLLELPVGFEPHPKLWRLISRRGELIDEPGGIDWAFAEALAFASILADGIPVRLSGQDAERGTFSHRHLVLHDATGDASFVPLQHLRQATASFAVYNSPLTEAAVIGFEYGYSVHAPETLVVWEAQFGDFVNAGQVLIDQFLVAARAKWRQYPALVMLLPHGFEGQGPEHSSARLERFLQLAAEENLRICNCTTSAQYFHLLRLQAAALESDRRPLILVSPKSLLRHRAAASSLRDLADGQFWTVLSDPRTMDDAQAVEQLILCSGKVAVDLDAAREQRSGRPIAVVRVEQLYPFPADELRGVLDTYPNLKMVAWLQEEPRNMGAWTFVAPRLRTVLPNDIELTYIGRPERASTAVGSPDVHADEQARIVQQALDLARTKIAR